MERLSLVDIGKFLVKKADMTEFVNGVRDGLNREIQLDQIRQELDLKHHVIRRTVYYYSGPIITGMTVTREVEGIHTREERKKIFYDYDQEYLKRKAEIDVDKEIHSRSFRYKVGRFLGDF